MMRCPKCQRTDYKSQGWFERHMMKDHNWTAERAATHWNGRCPKCGAPVVNSMFCLKCKHWFGRKPGDAK